MGDSLIKIMIKIEKLIENLFKETNTSGLDSLNQTYLKRIEDTLPDFKNFVFKLIDKMGKFLNLKYADIDSKGSYASFFMYTEDEANLGIYICYIGEDSYELKISNYYGFLFTKKIKGQSGVESFVHEFQHFVKQNSKKVTYDSKKDSANGAVFTIMIVKWLEGKGGNMVNKDKNLNRSYKTLEKFGKSIGITDPNSLK